MWALFRLRRLIGQPGRFLLRLGSLLASPRRKLSALLFLLERFRFGLLTGKLLGLHLGLLLLLPGLLLGTLLLLLARLALGPLAGAILGQPLGSG